MEFPMSTRRYRVRLVRPLFQVAVVDVEAADEEVAMLEALSQAGTITEKEWVGEFDPDGYFYDVQYVEEAEESDDDYIFTGIEKDRKYLLLKADTDSGEGEITFQPWMSEVSDLMVADLCSDWSGQLEELEEEGASNFYESLEKQLQVKNKTPAKVIPIRRTDSNKAD
jgi:hypothetical protein